jgi:HK97 family phage portal protein
VSLWSRIGAGFVGLAERAGWLSPFTHSADPDSERRDYFQRGGYYGSQADGAMQVTALAACVRLVSGSTAKLPFPVYRRIGEEGRERDREHPVDGLLNRRPNRWQTAFEFRRMLTAHAAMHGNGIALKRREGARVVELIPWHPSQVSVYQESEGAPPVYELQRKGGGRTRHPAADIFHLRDLTLDGLRGLSRVEQAQQGLSLTMAAESFGLSYFANGAEVSLAITADGLTEQQAKAVEKAVEDRHQGARRAHKPMVLAARGAQIKSLAASNKDSQMLELRSFQVEDIARLYGVPPHMIGLTEKQTSYGTGVEHMAQGFLQFSLLDWLVMWETAAARDLFDDVADTGYFAEHNVDGLLRADFKTRMDGYRTGIECGVLLRNEARRLENRPPYEGGDRPLYPANMAVEGAPVAAADLEEQARRAAEFKWRLAFRRADRALREREAA